MALLQVAGLGVSGPGGASLLEGVDLELDRGQILFLVGPSGAGKSLTLLALAGLLPCGLAARGLVRLDGEEFRLPAAGLGRLLGRKLSLVVQEPGGALDPAMTAGAQVAEALRCRFGGSRGAARARAEAALVRIGLPPGSAGAGAFPHQLSGGMRQRVLLAAHLALEPALLLLDEPTAALDPIRTADFASRVREECRGRGVGVVWVSHDPRLAQALGDRVVRLEPRRGFRPRFPAEEGLPAAPPPAAHGSVLRAEGLAVHLGGRRILDGIELALAAGQIVALVGPSGSGKSTLVRALLGLVPLAAGRVECLGRTVLAPGLRPGPRLRAAAQPLFQDPGGSLNPRRTVGQALAEGLRLGGRASRPAEAAALLAEVGLAPDAAGRFPHQLSGGERQRAALARALSVGPRALLLDEPFSGLDPPLRAELGGRLRRLARAGRAALLVTHHLGDACAAADRLGVLVAGRIVEWGAPEAVLERPRHPWTRALAECFSRPADPPPAWALAAGPEAPAP